MISNFIGHSIETSKLAMEIQRKFIKLAKDAVDKDVLTNDEKFAMCVAAGMRMVAERGGDENTMRWSIVKKAAVVKIDGAWVVVVDEG